MKAGQRLGLAIGVAALVLAATPTLAQTAPPLQEETPESGAIGPRELQNFSIDGTVTRRADPPPAQRLTPPAQRPAPAAQTAKERLPTLR